MKADQAPMDAETGAKFIFRNTVRAALFTVWFALTVGSTVPWLWMMSIDAHWYSTMYSWYTFASSFCFWYVFDCPLVNLHEEQRLYGID